MTVLQETMKVDYTLDPLIDLYYLQEVQGKTMQVVTEEVVNLLENTNMKNETYDTNRQAFVCMNAIEQGKELYELLYENKNRSYSLRKEELEKMLEYLNRTLEPLLKSSSKEVAMWRYILKEEDEAIERYFTDVDWYFYQTVQKEGLSKIREIPVSTRLIVRFLATKNTL